METHIVKYHTPLKVWDHLSTTTASTGEQLVSTSALTIFKRAKIKSSPHKKHAIVSIEQI